MSERSCRRVLDGTIKAPTALLDQIKVRGLTSFEAMNAPESISRKAARRKHQIQHFSDNDKAEFIGKVMQAYGTLADAYYLQGDVEPILRVRKDALVISIPLANAD